MAVNKADATFDTTHCPSAGKSAMLKMGQTLYRVMQRRLGFKLNDQTLALDCMNIVN